MTGIRRSHAVVVLYLVSVPRILVLPGPDGPGDAPDIEDGERGDYESTCELTSAPGPDVEQSSWVDETEE